MKIPPPAMQAPPAFNGSVEDFGNPEFTAGVKTAAQENVRFRWELVIRCGRSGFAARIDEEDPATRREA